MLHTAVELLRNPESKAVRKLEMTNNEIGIQEGIQKEKIETVLRLRSIGFNIEQIAIGAGISVEEVENIINHKAN